MSYIDALDAQIRLVEHFGTANGKMQGERLINGRNLAEHMQLNLIYAETYSVGAEICDLLRAVSKTLPDNAGIARADLPSQAGFVWLDKPTVISVPSKRGNLTSLQAYSWHIWADSDDYEGVLLMLYEREDNYTFPGVVGVIFLPFGSVLADVDVIASSEEDRKSVV